MSSDTAQRDAAPEAAPPVKPIADAVLPIKLDSLRLTVPHQKASAFTSPAALSAAAAGGAAARSPARPPPSPSQRALLARKGSFSERPIDVIRMALVMQRNVLCSLVGRWARTLGACRGIVG